MRKESEAGQQRDGTGEDARIATYIIGGGYAGAGLSLRLLVIEVAEDNAERLRADACRAEQDREVCAELHTRREMCRDRHVPTKS